MNLQKNFVTVSWNIKALFAFLDPHKKIKKAKKETKSKRNPRRE